MHIHHNMITEQLWQGGALLTVDKINHNKILITLCGEDMRNFALDYGTLSLYDSHSRRIIMRILNLACFKTGIETQNKSMFVEALPLEKGCAFLLTLVDRSRHFYRIKGTQKSVCYRLGGSRNFLDAMEKLYRQNVCCNKNSAYLYRDSYYLIFDYPSVPKKLRLVLGEYAERCGGNIFAAKLRESGKEICRTNAITQIGSAV